jgi:hypothetical protein
MHHRPLGALPSRDRRPRHHRELAQAIGADGDSISAGIGSSVYVTSHVLTGTDESMAVNRFYFEAAPPVAVDFSDETTEDNAEEKAAWCAEHGVRYLLADDEAVFADPAGLRRSLSDRS